MGPSAQTGAAGWSSPQSAAGGWPQPQVHTAVGYAGPGPYAQPPPERLAPGGPTPQGWPGPCGSHTPAGYPAAPPSPDQRQAEPRPSALTLVIVTLWRLAIGGAALMYAADGADETMSTDSLSYLSNVGVGVGFLALATYPLLVGGRRHEPRSGWLRGALTVTMLLVAGVFLVGMGGELDGPHAVVPALVLVDWLLVGRNQFRTRAWEPPTWIAFLLAYLVYHRANDLGLYPDILGDDAIGTVVPILLAMTVVVAYVLHGVTLVRRSLSGADRRDHPAMPR